MILVAKLCVLCSQSDYVYFKIALGFVIKDDDIKSRCRYRNGMQAGRSQVHFDHIAESILELDKKVPAGLLTRDYMVENNISMH